jgi:hypothetical protein
MQPVILVGCHFAGALNNDPASVSEFPAASSERGPDSLPVDHALELRGEIVAQHSQEFRGRNQYDSIRSPSRHTFSKRSATR